MKLPDSQPGPICPEEVQAFRRSFDSRPGNRTALNAVTKTPINQVAMNRSAVTRSSHTYSHLVKSGASTSQERTGRCWMFAGLNTFRMAAARSLNVEDFELSQNYMMFWDKLEKANYFLESILGTLEEETGSRLMAWLMANPIVDGGQWDMFANLVKKYGTAPKEVMPETESSSSSGGMNNLLTTKLREDAARLRQAHERRAPNAELRREKSRMMEEIFRILTIHLGEPPQEFLWQWRDKDKEFHRDGVITPREFFNRHVGIEVDDRVCLIHCPQSSKSFNTLYTVDFLGNVVGGDIVRYLNVELPIMKAAAVAMIKDEKAVWFGCDVGKSFDRDLGIMDAELYDYAGVYGVEFTMSKAERLDYGHSAMNHAMVFTGVDLDENDRPRKWRVENSWGEKGGDKGYMLMTDRWFDEYNYEVVVEKQYLPKELLPMLDQKPVHLPPWDPMGALARG